MAGKQAQSLAYSTDDGATWSTPVRVSDSDPWFDGEFPEITVDGSEVDWWVEDRQVHAATLDGLARGLAWAAGRWSTPKWTFSPVSGMESTP